MKNSALLGIWTILFSTSLANAQSDLYVSTGTEVTVLPSTTLYLGGIVSGGGVVTLNADATGYAQLEQGSTSANTGTVTVEKYLDNTNAGWRNFYFPFAGNYSDINFNSSLAFINETNDQGIAARHNFFKWNAADAGSGVATGWEAVASNDPVTSSAMVYSDNTNSIHTFNQTISASGIANNGSVSFTLVNTLDPNYSGATPSDGTGWNYIGNPYPTNISISSLFALASFPTYEAIHVLDQKNGGQYVAVLSSGVAVDYNTTGGSTTGVSHIQPFQGFWVKTDANATLTLDNSIRDAAGTATAYMKSSYDLLRLNLTSQDNLVDQVVIYFEPNATEDYDFGLEALKVYATTPVPSMAALDPNNRRMSIMALGNNGNETIIPLEIGSHVEGTPHTLTLIDTELPVNYEVYLEDTQNNTVVDLRTQSVTIVPNALTRAGRYQIHVSASGVSVPELNSESSMIAAWINERGNVSVSTPSSFTGSIQLMETSGRIISSTNCSDCSTIEISSPNASGVYFIRLISNSGVMTKTEKLIY